jgi:hypothetical protein
MWGNLFVAPKKTKRYTRHLENSISFFGVGGKQAAFYLGEGVRIFTKMAGGDVLEFGMSRDGFNENIEANESNPFHGSSSICWFVL